MLRLIAFITAAASLMVGAAIAVPKTHVIYPVSSGGGTTITGTSGTIVFNSNGSATGNSGLTYDGVGGATASTQFNAAGSRLVSYGIQNDNNGIQIIGNGTYVNKVQGVTVDYATQTDNVILVKTYIGGNSQASGVAKLEVAGQISGSAGLFAALNVTGTVLATSWTAINQTGPATAPLEVSGTISATAIQIGTGVACTKVGQLRYNSVSNTVQFCTGTKYVSLISGT